MENTLNSWEIVESPIFANFKQIQGYKAISRSDTNEILHVAKETYTPTSNARFIETAEALSKITGYPLQMISEIEKGKKALAFLKVNDPMRVGGHEFKEWLMLGNSHDGSTGFFVGNSNMMVRCSNRFTKTFRQMNVHHTSNHDERITRIIGGFEDYTKQRSRFIDTLGEYIDFEIVKEDKQQIVNLIADVKPEEIENPEKLSTRKTNIISDIHYSIEKECSALGNNVFGLFNGITHYTSHIRKEKNKVFNNALGTSNEINQKAFNFCSSLIRK